MLEYSTYSPGVNYILMAHSAEHHVGEVRLPNQNGRNFLVRFFVKPDGYTGGRGEIECTDCKTYPTVYRAELYNHLDEPQGSEYFCRGCKPETFPATSE
jgi:hypothetical protein